jgi:PPP family 3-phenylpropionic acid transporter
MGTPLRLGLFYSALYVGTGVGLPYIGVWMAHRGLSGAEIGLILAVPMIARAVTGPLIAVWADGFRLRRTPLVWLSLGSAGLYALMGAPAGFWGWLAIWFAAVSVFSALTPLTDVIAMARVRLEGFNYGWPRGLGSVAFTAANIAGGWLIARTTPELVIDWIAAAALLASAAALLLPADPVRTAREASAWRDRLAGLGALFRDRDFVLATCSVGLIQSAHAFYYGFSALAWKQQGLEENLTGLLWGLAVAVEVAFLWFMEPWRRRMGPLRLLLLGGAAAVVRWTALAFSPPLWLLFPLQGLHTLTFAATFVASLQLVERLSTPANVSSAQMINSALSGGMIAGVATIASGWLFDGLGALGYLAMAAMAAAGLAGAAVLARSERARD